MKLLLSCLLIVNFFFANGRDLIWHEGALVLEDGSVRTGCLHVDNKHLVVLFLDNDSSVSVYTPDKIRGAWFYDAGLNVNRKFRSVFRKNTSNQRWMLLEVVVYGDISVLRSPKNYSRGALETEFLQYDYYVIFDDRFFSLRKFGRMVFPDVVKGMPTLSDFASAERLSFYSDQDAILLIEKFNQLTRVESGVQPEGHR